MSHKTKRLIWFKPFSFEAFPKYWDAFCTHTQTGTRTQPINTSKPIYLNSLKNQKHLNVASNGKWQTEEEWANTHGANGVDSRELLLFCVTRTHVSAHSLLSNWGEETKNFPVAKKNRFETFWKNKNTHVPTFVARQGRAKQNDGKQKQKMKIECSSQQQKQNICNN